MTTPDIIVLCFCFFVLGVHVGSLLTQWGEP